MSLLNLIPNYQLLPPFINRGDSVVVSLRDSGGTDQEDSTTQQLEMITAWCDYHDIRIIRVYEDKATSGTRTDREHYERMKRDLIEKRVDTNVVVFWRFDRQGRNYNYDMAVYFEFQHLGLHMHSLADSIKGEGWVRDLEFMLQKRADSAFSKKLSEDVRRGQHRQMRNGFSVGRAPTGYLRQPVTVPNPRTGGTETKYRLVADPSVAPYVKRAFELAASGVRHGDIYLATDGRLGTAKNSEARLSYMLRNRAYIGEYEFGGVVYKDFAPAIVDEALFNRVQKKLRSFKKRSGIHYPLSGVLFCSCGGALYGRTRKYSGTGTISRRYICSNTHKFLECSGVRIVDACEVERAILDEIKSVVLGDTWIEAVYKRTSEEASDKDFEAQLSALYQQESVVNAEIANLSDAIAATGFSDIFKDKIQELSEKRGAIADDILQLREERDSAMLVSKDALAAVRDSIKIAIDSGNTNMINDMLKALVERIEVSAEEVRIIYSITPDYMLG